VLHPPSAVLRRYLQTETAIDGLSGWPSYIGATPAVGGNVIAFKDVGAISQGRSMASGEYMYRWSVSVEIESDDYEEMASKCAAVSSILDGSDPFTYVTYGSVVYVLHTLSRATSWTVVRDMPDSRRRHKVAATYTIPITLSPWVMASGFWDDDGQWVDNGEWTDNA